MKAIKTILLSVALLAVYIQANAQGIKPSLNNVFANYVSVKNALVADDGTAAKNKAKELNAKIAAISTKDMSASQQGVWKMYADKLNFDSRHISETTAIAHQREHFASLSKNMYEVLKAFKVNSAPVYWQYCPMKKQAWLSETSTIKNPYYGSEMEDCGKTTETLKAVK